MLQLDNITPTLPGPFEVIKEEEAQRRAGHQDYHSKYQIRKKDAAATGADQTDGSAPSTETSKPTAPSGTKGGQAASQDEQNDSEYLTPVQIGTPAQTLHATVLDRTWTDECDLGLVN
jgi:hypothetical protein